MTGGGLTPAELREMLTEWQAKRPADAPWPLETLPDWTLGDRLKIAAVNALPALLDALAQQATAREGARSMKLHKCADAGRCPHCSFCGLGGIDVFALISAPTANICDQCIRDAQAIVDDVRVGRAASENQPANLTNPAELNRQDSGHPAGKPSVQP